MNSVWLLTNGGSGEDGDEWHLFGVYRTRLDAENARNNFYVEVEEWNLWPCNHEWEGHTNPDTPNDPAESVAYCKNCGKEKTD